MCFGGQAANARGGMAALAGGKNIRGTPVVDSELRRYLPGRFVPDLFGYGSGALAFAIIPGQG